MASVPLVRSLPTVSSLSSGANPSSRTSPFQVPCAPGGLHQQLQASPARLKPHARGARRPLAPGRGRVSATAVPAAGGRNWSLGAPDRTVDLCIFPMWSMPLPTFSGSLNVFEPHLVDLLQVVQQVAAASMDGAPARFGALPYDWVQHEMLANEPDALTNLTFLSESPSALQGFPSLHQDAVGSCCQIEAALQDPQGDSYCVKFHATRRFKPVEVLRRQPFLVVRCQWVDDDRAKPGFEGVSTGALEQQVWGKIQEIVRVTGKLAGSVEPVHCCGGDDAALPQSVCKFSPLSAPPPTTAEERVRAWSTNSASRMPAEVNVWRNMRSASAVVSHAPPASSIPHDPYQAACEKISKTVRQEAFSFAAATMVEMGADQRKQLLAMTNTGERLHWVLEAIEPHLAALRAEYSMRQAMGDL